VALPVSHARPRRDQPVSAYGYLPQGRGAGARPTNAAAESVGARTGHTGSLDCRHLSADLAAGGWPQAALDAYYEFDANRIVAEKNNGGEMVRLTIKTVDPNVPVKLVTASRGKRVRAEPVAALYEPRPDHPLGRVFHVGPPTEFAALEEQMTTWTPESESPDAVSRPDPQPDAALYEESEQHALGRVFQVGVFPELDDQMVTWPPEAHSPNAGESRPAESLREQLSQPPVLSDRIARSCCRASFDARITQARSAWLVLQRDDVWLDGIRYSRFPTSRNKNQRRYWMPPRGSGKDALHREIWKKHRGAIPSGAHVHHRDGDPLNNDVENLACVTPKEHAALHAEEFSDARRAQMDRARVFAAAWHRSPEGRQWHREHGRASWQEREAQTIVCSWCGREAERFFTTRATTRFCSRKCSRAAADAEGRYEQTANCPICAGTFRQNKYRCKPETCSRKCGAELRRRRRLGSAERAQDYQAPPSKSRQEGGENAPQDGPERWIKNHDGLERQPR
jgi:hypothetical protein